MPMRRLFVLAFLPLTGAAQQTRALGAPQAEHPANFSSLTGLRELSDGRLVVVDGRERAVLLVDFRRGTSERIGRDGSGPGEVAAPTNLLRLPADTSAVWDSRNRRLFVILPSGTPGATQLITGADGSAPAIPLQAPRFSDASGRLYFSGIPAEGTTPDSLPILRMDRRTARIDTVGMLKRPKGGDQAVMGPPGRQMTISIANPFSPQEAWVVTQDGRVAVARSPEYRLDWAFPTGVRGRETAYSRKEVTEADKENWRRSQGGPVVLVADVGARGTAPPISSVPEPTTWPKVMPPFLAANNPVLADETGRVWIAQTRSATDRDQVYDVFGATGEIVLRVSLPSERRVAGFGNGVVYTIRTDDDGFLHLGRHALPR
jgi:hypothetical protein